MKVVVFGASGRTGIPLVQQALNAGHEVVAFVRTPSRLPIKHERLSVVQGDVMNAGDVERALASKPDAVITALSPTKGTPKEMLPKASENILKAMKQHNIRRIVWMTGAGVPAPEDKPKPINHVIKFMLKTLSGDVLKASEEAVDMVRSSDRDWVVVRAPMLTDGEHTGKYRVGWVGVNTGARLARADAADFLLKQVTDSNYLRKAPMLSN
ncbi:MAG: NAD(P)H-binding protein [bacterium]|nr:NAD(P)H-binding protein [bacterium]